MYLNGSETKRLNFRKLNISDIPEWGDFFINNDSLPYLGLDLSLSPAELSRDWINKQIKRYESDKFGYLALIEKSSGIFIGQCGFLEQEIKGSVEIEIGCHILPKYWGQGFASEAARFFRDFAFENNISESLISIIDKRNTASQKVAEKNGFHKDSEIKLSGLDGYIFKIDKKSWNPE